MPLFDEGSWRASSLYQESRIKSIDIGIGGINQSRAMRIAQRRIEGFAQQFGEAHRNLARHAAFPLVLTPDLLYQIWANFVPEAPWTAVAHMLLSRLCRQVGYEMYEMDIADRNLLLRELKEQFKQERFDELGEFLLDYVAQRLTDDDADTQDLREAQEWTALAYTKPGEAVRELAKRLSQRVQQEDMGEVLRLASLVETLAEPLLETGYQALLVYSYTLKRFVLKDFGAVELTSENFDQKLKMLVVDDEPDNLELLYRTFRRDFQVFKATNGNTALDILKQEGEMAVIITDQRMPEMNGTEFLNRTLEQFPNTIRILLTSFADTDDLADAIHSSMVFKCITKPWHTDKFKEIVKQAADIYRIIKKRTNEISRQLFKNWTSNAESITNQPSSAKVDLESDVIRQMLQSQSLNAHIKYRLYLLKINHYLSEEDVINYVIQVLIDALRSGKQVEHPIAWSKLVADRYINSQYRKSKLNENKDNDEIEKLIDSQNSFNADFNYPDRDLIINLISGLKPKTRKLIELRYFQNLSWIQIAELLSKEEGRQISAAIARKRGERALSELRKILTVLEVETN